MAIKPLNHYSITSSASMYDEDAVTALELAGRTAAKVNEAVDAFNELEKKTNETLETEIPAEVKKEFSENVKNGTFDEMISEFAGDINIRIDNLAGGLTPGSTTADAELMDIRWADQLYPGAGNATRAIYDYAKTAIDLIHRAAENKAFAMKGTPVEIHYTNSTILNSSGGLQTVDTAQFAFKTARVNVDELSFYHINAKANYGNALISVFDNEDGLIPNTVIVSENAPTFTEFNGLYFMPKNAAYVRISYHHPDVLNAFDGMCYKIEQITVNDDLNILPTITAEFNRLFDSGTGTVFNVSGSPIVAAHIYEGAIINELGVMQFVTSTIEGYKVEKIPVTPGKLYHVKACANYGNATFSFYDANGECLEIGDISNDENAYTYTNGIKSAPANADHILIAFNENAAIGVVEKDIKLSPIPSTPGTSTNKKWKGLKWVCIGDSLTERNSRSDKFYHDYIAEETGIEVVNLGISGTGYARGYEDGNSFYHQVENIPEDADIITIFGSFNDLDTGREYGTYMDNGAGDGSSIAAFVNSLLWDIRFKCPLARIGVIAPTPWESVSPSEDCGYHPYVSMLGDCAKAQSVPFLNLFTDSNLYPNHLKIREAYYSKDDGNGVHPNELGHKVIAAQIREFIAKLI